MKKILSIGAWYSFMLLLALIVLSLYGERAESKALSANDQFILDFSQRLKRFSASKPPRTVVVGSCYAALIGESEDVFNLGCASTGPEDVFYLLEHLHPSDHLVYVLPWTSLFDQPFTGAPKSFLRSQRLLDAWLSRLEFRSRIGFSSAYVWPAAAPEEKRSLRLALGPEANKDGERMTIARLKAYCGQSISLDHVERVLAVHPNTVIAIHPVMTFEPVPRSAPLCAEISSFRANAQRASMLFAENHIAVLPQLSNSSFTELDHLEYRFYPALLSEVTALTNPAQSENTQHESL